MAKLALVIDGSTAITPPEVSMQVRWYWQKPATAGAGAPAAAQVQLVPSQVGPPVHLQALTPVAAPVSWTHEPAVMLLQSASVMQTCGVSQGALSAVPWVLPQPPV